MPKFQGPDAWWNINSSAVWAKHSKPARNTSLAPICPSGLCLTLICIDSTNLVFNCEQGAGQQIVIQQPQQAQILQTSDGQTLIYQPVQLEQPNIQQQPQSTCKYTKLTASPCCISVSIQLWLIFFYQFLI